MKKKYLYIALLFFIAVFVGYYSIFIIDNVDTALSSTEIPTLTVVGEFPNENDEIFIGNIAATEATEAYTYLLEHRGGFILKFDKEGNFITQIGQPGRGPEELINPLDFVVVQDKVYTLEQGKMQIQEFNDNGKYLDTYFFHGAYMEMLKLNESFLLKNYYYKGMPEYSDMPDFDKYPLFTFFDPELNTTSAFGNYPTFFNDLGINYSGSFSVIYEEMVYTGYKGFPYVHVLNKNGDLEREIYLKGDGLEQILEYYLENPPESFPSIFLDMKVNDKGIFFSTYGEELELYHFDFDGNLENKFLVTKEKTGDRYIRTFDIIKSGKKDEWKLFATVHGINPRTLIVDIKLD